MSVEANQTLEQQIQTLQNTLTGSLEQLQSLTGHDGFTEFGDGFSSRSASKVRVSDEDKLSALEEQISGLRRRKAIADGVEAFFEGAFSKLDKLQDDLNNKLANLDGDKIDEASKQLQDFISEFGESIIDVKKIPNFGKDGEKIKMLRIKDPGGKQARELNAAEVKKLQDAFIEQNKLFANYRGDAKIIQDGMILYSLSYSASHSYYWSEIHKVDGSVEREQLKKIPGLHAELVKGEGGAKSLGETIQQQIDAKQHEITATQAAIEQQRQKDQAAALKRTSSSAPTLFSPATSVADANPAPRSADVSRSVTPDTASAAQQAAAEKAQLSFISKAINAFFAFCRSFTSTLGHDFVSSLNGLLGKQSANVAPSTEPVERPSSPGRRAGG